MTADSTSLGGTHRSTLHRLRGYEGRARPPEARALVGDPEHAADLAHSPMRGVGGPQSDGTSHDRACQASVAASPWPDPPQRWA
jgi:hypothetical protein